MIKISQEIADNAITDTTKVKISMRDKAKLYLAYMRTYTMTKGQFSRKFHIKKTTLADILAHARPTETQYKKLQEKGLTQTHIHKVLQRRLDKTKQIKDIEVADVEPSLDDQLRSLVKLLYMNQVKTQISDETLDLVFEAEALLRKLKQKIESLRRG